jgi:orotate phosphoribosyltransferase
MDYCKDAFIRLAIQCKVLKFGQYTLKSGRISPYFFNAGLFYHGESLSQLGEFYAKTLLEHNINCQHLFGPAYKGIPLVTATAIALAAKGVNASITFNRKEVKSHGEGGQLIGSPLSGDIVMVDDVITAGTAFREAQELIVQNGASLSAVIIALNRCERGNGDRSTLAEIEAQGIRVVSIISLFDLIDYLKREGNKEQVVAIEAYLEHYGC